MIGTRLKRPCQHCPFRTDRPGYLRAFRAAKIAQCLREHCEFVCHATVEYDDETGEGEITPRSEQCAGAMIVLTREHNPNILMRLRMLSGEFDPVALDMESPVFANLDDFVQHHRRGDGFGGESK